MVGAGGEEVSLLLPFQLLLRLREFLTAKRVRGFLVGGCVRDGLLGRTCADVDIAVQAPALELAREFADRAQGAFVPLDEAHAIARVVLPAGEIVDFSTVFGDIASDLSRRDFTIDAMAVDVEDISTDSGAFTITDPLGGRQDLSKKLVRAASSRAFEEDPARLLRAVRLAAELGFTVEKGTEQLIKQHAGLAGLIAGERTRDELMSLLALPGVAPQIYYLDRVGLLTVLLPELAAAKGVGQPPEHHWDVFEHSLKTVEAVEELIERPIETPEARGERQEPPTSHLSPLTSNDVLAAAPWSEALERHFTRTVGGVSRRALVKLSALLHDVAKPQTKSVEPTGRIRFLGHGQEGARIAVEVLERWRFSNKEIRLVESIVLHHLRPTQLAQGDEMPTHRAIYRYFRDVGDAAIDTLYLSLADHRASRGPDLTREGWLAHVRVIAHILEAYFKEESVARPPKLVDGHDLMAILGLRPGPVVGDLLEGIREAQAAGEIGTREEALAWGRRRLAVERRGNS